MSDPGRLVDTLLRVPFSLSTLAGDPATGIAWTLVWGRDGAGNAWAPVVSESEQGGGLYELGSTPAVTGWHHAWITGIDGAGARRNVAFSERVVATTGTVVLRPGDAVELLVLTTDSDGLGTVLDPTVDAALTPTGTTFTPTITDVAGHAGAALVGFTFPANDASLGPWSVALTVATAQPYRLTESWDVMRSSAIDVSSLLEADVSGTYASGTFGAYVQNFYAALGASRVTVTSPVDPLTGNVTVYQGDDQVAAASRSLGWATSSEGRWPDLTNALSIELQGDFTPNRAHQVTADGSVVTPTGANKQVMVELDRDATMALREGTYEIQVIATLADGNVETLVDAEMQVVRRKGA